MLLVFFNTYCETVHFAESDGPEGVTVDFRREHMDDKVIVHKDSHELHALLGGLEILLNVSFRMVRSRCGKYTECWAGHPGRAETRDVGTYTYVDNNTILKEKRL